MVAVERVQIIGLLRGIILGQVVHLKFMNQQMVDIIEMRMQLITMFLWVITLE